jgi:hypothetical protein
MVRVVFSHDYERPGVCWTSQRLCGNQQSVASSLTVPHRTVYHQLSGTPSDFNTTYYALNTPYILTLSFIIIHYSQPPTA